MGRKKKKQLKPWCWYCNREFDDEKILIQHQKSKHFKCTFCHKKLYTGPGLSIHSMQVHKEKIDKIPYALPHRSNCEIEIYGMEGIPDEDIKDHERQKMGKEDEVEEKKIKLEVPLTNPVFPMTGLPLPAPGVPFMPPLTVPVMPPLQFGLAPPPIFMRPTLQVPGLLQHGIARLNPIVNPVPVGLVLPTQQSTHNLHNQVKIENTIPPPPPPPPIVETVNPATSSVPTFPAYSGNVEVTKTVQKVTKPTSSTPSLKVILVHPEDDLPLEQIRLKLSKYSSFLNTPSVSEDMTWCRTSVQNSENEIVPPPPPPTINTFAPQLSTAMQRPPTMVRPWIASNLGVFVKPHQFGGTGF